MFSGGTPSMFGLSTAGNSLKQGSHIHDFQQDFNKTKTHAVKCEEQVAVLRSEITEPYTRLH